LGPEKTKAPNSSVSGHRDRQKEKSKDLETSGGKRKDRLSSDKLKKRKKTIDSDDDDDTDREWRGVKDGLNNSKRRKKSTIK
jgi:hypothetical protein